jgi:hypothetical protein
VNVEVSQEISHPVATLVTVIGSVRALNPDSRGVAARHVKGEAVGRNRGKA